MRDGQVREPSRQPDSLITDFLHAPPLWMWITSEQAPFTWHKP